VLLVGYSMGGALAIAAAARHAPDALVLLAPFWRLGSGVQRVVGSVLGPFLPRYWQPLKRSDLDNPEVREPIADLMPGLDLDDPDVRSELRRFSIPLSLVEQVDRTGRAGYRKARNVESPVLIVQGAADSLVKPEYTERLLRRFPSTPDYLVLDAGHDLIAPTQGEWAGLAQAVREFAAAVRERER
jgi:pimeloyl-ACP methyl ester carboxylesterase